MSNYFFFSQNHYIEKLRNNEIINNCSFGPNAGFCSAISIYLLKKIMDEIYQSDCNLSQNFMGYFMDTKKFKYPSIQRIFDIAKKHSEIICQSGVNALSREQFHFNIDMIFIQKKTQNNPLRGYGFIKNVFPEEGCALLLLATMTYQETAEIHLDSLYHHDMATLYSSPNKKYLNHVGLVFWNKGSLFAFDPNTGGKLEEISSSGFEINKVEIAINSMYAYLKSSHRVRIMNAYLPDFSEEGDKHINHILNKM
ncbi:hypothetical protein FE392_12405 [Xenorhabdus sp. 12]|uniref:Virulence surface antigen n=1 Tax=Xenorhabdus santafensis TaxID=2582833 RepID=A0ABU4SBF9_9GAMM|nr:hypothetical protein [Xenorhabdus sp. 12]MDX7988122.1 hypothetical protein [Xenorhabdus sp. 12]